MFLFVLFQSMFEALWINVSLIKWKWLIFVAAENFRLFWTFVTKSVRLKMRRVFAKHIEAYWALLFLFIGQGID